MTAGPWRWEINRKTKHLTLVGGKPQFDLIILEPTRWGMGGATLLVRDTAHDGMNILHKLHERPDWIVPHPGRAHHADWCAGVKHPDLQLIEAAPDMLEALRQAKNSLVAFKLMPGPCNAWEVHDEANLKAVDEAIAKATGTTP